MPISRTYGCKLCGETWKHLHMTRDEPKPPCPKGCQAVTQEELSAPAVARGAADTGVAVPQSQAGRERLAADLALKNTGLGDINSHMKPGDIAAKPVKPNLPAGVAPSPVIAPQFIDTKSMGYAQAAGDPTKGRNLGILGAMSKTAPLNRLPRSVLARNQ